jgi:DNA-binding NtrC family response regulator
MSILQPKSSALQFQPPFIDRAEVRIPNNRIRVLIVDDDAFIRDSLSEILACYGFRVRCVDGACAALSAIRQEMPDLLLSDLNMPGLSGFELLSAVRHRYPLLYVIAMSGAFVGDAVPPGVAADAFYPKSSGINTLLDIIASTAGSVIWRADQSS